MEFKMRRYQTEEDYWRMRAFLREVFLLNQRFEHSWSVPRLDYWRWHFIATCESPSLEQSAFLWETPDGQLAAFVHPIFYGEVFVHIHPAYRSEALEDEIFACAEEHLAVREENHSLRLVTLVDMDDELRQKVLDARGYFNRDNLVNHWYRNLDQPLPDVPVAEGYKVRSMGDTSEYDARSLASWRAFHPGEPDEGAGSGDWFANMQFAPLYRRDLDMVAEAPNGEIAAFSTIWYDDFTRNGVCVVVGTAPDHQRKGLGKAVITEGLRRVKKMGGLRVFANGFDEPANALYRSALGSRIKAQGWGLK